MARIQPSAVSFQPRSVEGCGRSSDADLARFLGISAGSASEAESLLLLAHDLTYLPAQDYRQLASGVVEIKKMLAAFIAKLAAER
jgi:four helix bundle protein